MARGAATAVHPGMAGVDLVLGDVTIPTEVERALGDADVVFHFAGRSGAAASTGDPIADLHTNVGGLIVLLEAARRRGGNLRLIFPGSRLEYGVVEQLPVHEDAPLRPLVPYGLNKAQCEGYLDLYARLYGIRYAVARLSNPYGPWSAPAAREYNVFNQMIAAAARGETITVYGTGEQLRDYIFVEDVVDALIAIAECEENLVVNVGSGRGVLFREAAETIVRVCGTGSVSYVPWPVQARRIETGDFVADVSRMSALGWAARTGLEEGIRRTIEARA